MRILRRSLPLALISVLFAITAEAQQACGNLTCEQGEDASNCPADCIPSPICGDLICDPSVGEDAAICPSDCEQVGPVCGNSSCEAGEDISTCPADCGSEGAVCGNGSCEAGEDAASCPADCGGGPGYVCGDSICTPDVESCGNCLQDCPCWMEGTTCNPSPYPGTCENVCGNGLCGPGENAGNCAQDCPVQCGDAICSIGESCLADCAGCGDGFCDPGIGENDLSCAQDCSAGNVCTPDGVCDAGAGENQQNCSADCGGAPTCNFDGLCGGGEDASSCPADCSTPTSVCGDNTCTPYVESCGNCLRDCPCAGGTTCSPSPAPGICVSQCGNGTCDGGETAASCLEDCGSCDNDGICDLLENAETCPSDCTAPVCDFSDLPQHLQICCGDGTCDSGENPNKCAKDCPASCGDGLCSPLQGENSDSCSQDCCYSEITCEAGCAAMPTFEISPANGQVAAFQEVTFTAFPDHITGTTVNWDFGDGEHCERCGLSVTHRYGRIGNFAARLTASDNVCGTAVVSFPQYVAVGMPPLRDDAQVISTTIPACVQPGQVASAIVRIRNVGGTTWGAQHGQELRRLAGDTIMLAAAVALPPSLNVPPGAVFDFPVQLGTPDQVGDHTLSLQMGNVHGLFGDVSTSRLTVSPTCGSAQPMPGDYTCRVQIVTSEGVGVPNVPVRLTALNRNEETQEVLAAHHGLTDGEGVAYLAVMHPQLPIHTVACSALEIETTEPPHTFVTDPDDVPVPQHLELLRVQRRTFAPRVNLPGLKNKIIASARLYQSGSYDRPVVIPAGFNPGEQRDPYNDESLYRLYEPFVSRANLLGLDVWLMRTTTGQNIHEQSAEFAQLIDYAARRLGPDGKVVVAGYSLGGVVSRLATAMYQADGDWRNSLAIQRHDLPVNLIAFGDAPLTGANIPFALQTIIWEKLSPNDRAFPYSQLPQAMAKSNLNSCGAQQLLRKSYPTLGSNFDRFWNLGHPVSFPNLGDPGGVCDRVAGDNCICDFGPAVLSVNGDGWAHGVRTVAYSDGGPGPQGCFGFFDGRDVDRDRKRLDVCRDLGEFGQSRPFFPPPEFPMFRVQLPFAGDEYVYPAPEDLGTGARISLIAETECEDPFGVSICGGIKKQYFSPTFIPFDSALPPSAPFSRTWHTEGYQGVHGNGPDANVFTLLGEISNAFAGPPAARPAFAMDVAGAPGQAVIVTFPNVLSTGQVSASRSMNGPALPSGLVMGEGEGYYEIASTIITQATRNDPIEVCIGYGDARFMDESRLLLYHFDGVVWADVTSFRDADANRACGVTTSLSPFALLEPANTAPRAPRYAPAVLEATGPGGAQVSLNPSGFVDPDGEALSFTWADELGVVTHGPAFSATLSVGPHLLTVTARDPRGGVVAATREVLVRDTQAPSVSIQSAGVSPRQLGAVASDAVGVASLQIEIDGQVVSEEAGPSLNYSWDTTGVSDGPHEVRALARDAAGNESVSDTLVLIVDNTAPSLTLNASPSVLWPPNGRLILTTVSVSLSDALDPAPTVRLVSARCADHLRRATGANPAERPCAAADLQGAALGTDDRLVLLRASRGGDVDQRVYALVYEAIDNAGNRTTTSVTVTIPHDRR